MCWYLEQTLIKLNLHLPYHPHPSTPLFLSPSLTLSLLPSLSLSLSLSRSFSISLFLSLSLPLSLSLALSTRHHGDVEITPGWWVGCCGVSGGRCTELRVAAQQQIERPLWDGERGRREEGIPSHKQNKPSRRVCVCVCV